MSNWTRDKQKHLIACKGILYYIFNNKKAFAEQRYIPNWCFLQCWLFQLRWKWARFSNIFQHSDHFLLYHNVTLESLLFCVTFLIFHDYFWFREKSYNSKFIYKPKQFCKWYRYKPMVFFFYFETKLKMIRFCKFGIPMLPPIFFLIHKNRGVICIEILNW